MNGTRIRKRGNDIRPNQSYLHTGCPFTLNIRISKSKTYYEITQVVDRHENHSISKNAFQLHPSTRTKINTDDNFRKVKQLIEADVPSRAIRKILKEDYDKTFTCQDVINLKIKLGSEERKNEVDQALSILENAKLKNPESELGIIYKEGEVVKSIQCLFWQSSI